MENELNDLMFEDIEESYADDDLRSCVDLDEFEK
jgi:hypothetical protein